MDGQLGADTRDLQALGEPHPADTPPDTETPPRRRTDPETRNRLFGALCRYIGLAQITLTVLVFTTWPEDQAGRVPMPVALIIGMAVLTVGGALFTASLFEWLGRYGRTKARQAIVGQIAAAKERAEDRESLRHLTALVTPLAGRLDAIEQRITNLPDYGGGVIDGIRMRSEVLGDIGDQRL